MFHGMKTRIAKCKNSRHALWLLPLLLLGGGCSGINATKSVSPLDFILPGLMKVEPAQPLAPEAGTALVCSAPNELTPGLCEPDSTVGWVEAPGP